MSEAALTLPLRDKPARGVFSQSTYESAARRVVPPTPARPTAPLPLWRLLLQIRRNAIGTWGEPAYELDVASGRFLGRKSMILNAPDAIRRVLVDNHANYGRTPATLRILHPMLGDGLFLAEGAAWKHQRRLVSPAFAPRGMDLVARQVALTMGEVVDDLRARARAPVDILRVTQGLTLEVAGRAFFSQAMRKHGAAIRGAMEAYGRNLARPSFVDFLLSNDSPDPLLWARRRAGARFKAVLDGIIAERAQQPAQEQPRDLYDVLVAARHPETGEPFTPEQLRDQIATLIVAGHETTALTLFWAFYLLSLSPEWQERVADEAAGVDLSPEGAPSACDRLPVTRAVVNETLRLYPPAYSIVRVAKEPDEIGGEEVPPGTLMVMSPWILHRHRKHWQDPDAFDPTRFLPGAETPERFTYLPFGVGPRVCIGAQFALVEATLALAAIVRAFRVELPGSKRIMPVAVVTTAPERAAPFRLTPREA